MLAWTMLLGLLAADKAAEAAKKELEKLQGTWVMESLEVDGQAVPEEKLQKTTLTIKGDKYVTKVKDRTFETTIQLDPTQKPKAIDMYFPAGTDPPKLAKGIYEVDGDRLKLCRHQMPGQDRPQQFGTWPNTGLFMVVWKRQT
jgi:uncharacterized protein (TIGR03067 family)